MNEKEVVPMKLDLIRALWPEKKGFCIHRQTERNFFIFVHFLTDAEAFFCGKWHKAKQGEWIVWHSRSPQGVRKKDGDLLHDWFHVVGEDTENILRRYGIETERLYTPIDDSFITREIHEIELEAQKRNWFFDDITRTMTEIFFAHLARDLKGTAVQKSRHLYKRFTKLRSEIMLHYNEALTVAEMAESLSLSPSRFHDLYKNYFGVSPAKDLQLARIEHAKLLLLQKDLSVAEVAKKAGYQSICHFIRQFKANIGITPGEYQEKIQQEAKE